MLVVVAVVICLLLGGGFYWYYGAECAYAWRTQGPFSPSKDVDEDSDDERDSYVALEDPPDGDARLSSSFRVRTPRSSQQGGGLIDFQGGESRKDGSIRAYF